MSRRARAKARSRRRTTRTRMRTRSVSSLRRRCARRDWSGNTRAPRCPARLPRCPNCPNCPNCPKLPQTAPTAPTALAGARVSAGAALRWVSAAVQGAPPYDVHVGGHGGGAAAASGRADDGVRVCDRPRGALVPLVPRLRLPSTDLDPRGRLPRRRHRAAEFAPSAQPELHRPNDHQGAPAVVFTPWWPCSPRRAEGLAVP